MLRADAGPVTGHDHAHGASTATGGQRRRLVVVAAVTAAVFLAEVVGGLLSGSLALLADAGHALTDASGLVIALVAASLATRPATTRRTFGWQRAEVLAALVNALLLTAIAVWVLVQAVARWNRPTTVASTLMLVVALGGAVANLVCLLVLRGGRDASLNLRGAYLEVLGDLLGSLTVVVAAVVIALTGFTRADAIASVVIFCLIVPRAAALLRDVVHVLLEGTPPGMDLDEVRRHITEAPGVLDVHDLHAWTITSGSLALSAHVVVADTWWDAGRSGEVLDHLGGCLEEHFEVGHCTFQLEPSGHRSHELAHHD